MGILALTDNVQVHGEDRLGLRTLASSMGHFVLGVTLASPHLMLQVGTTFPERSATR